jgi:hypothetical protein
MLIAAREPCFNCNKEENKQVRRCRQIMTTKESHTNAEKKKICA